MQLRDPKQQFGFGMGYAKKALDYAIRADKMNELVNQLDKFIDKTKEELLRGEVGLNKKAKTLKEITNSAYQKAENNNLATQDNQKHERHCQKYKQARYYAP
ncbi:4409_t:CDS:2 [Racocetra fulgida]|uniref:4409_t:CDS:1 n=1 Tax=Racocetra fulgida TaxID=60492 RepID=A0A9N9CGF7_9GLOM|nr:4409_t:CDS:2 [Racocetra fulgida]